MRHVMHHVMRLKATIPIIFARYMSIHYYFHFSDAPAREESIIMIKRLKIILFLEAIFLKRKPIFFPIQKYF